MLTADLVAVRRQKGELKLVPLDEKSRPRAIELCTAYLDIARSHIGATRDEHEEACAAVAVAPTERRLADGIQKLIDDRCEYDSGDSDEPEALRSEVFLRASAARRAAPAAAATEPATGNVSFDRAAVIAEVASARGLGVEAVERGLYSDLHGAHRLRSVRPTLAVSLVADFDLAQAQAVLLRAVRLTVEVECSTSAAYRALFRKLKFLRLLHRIFLLEKISPKRTAKKSSAGAEAYRIEIDGPFSLFESVTRYGLQLALVLPALRECRAYRLDAEVRWGKDRQPLRFRLNGGTGEDLGVEESSSEPRIQGVSARERLPDDVAALLEGLRAIEGPWRASPSTAIIALPGAGVCVPDLVFKHAATGERVFLEVLGYWSRDAVWNRVELSRGGLPERVLFAVGRHLRVSEAALDEEQAGALYVYKRTMNARAVLERVHELAERGLPSPTKVKSKHTSVTPE